MSTKIFITGGDGLLGSNLVRELLKKGYSLRVLVQPQRNSPTLNGLEIEKVSGDLLEEGNKLKEAMNGCEVVFHCAAITNLWAKRELVFKVNLEGTKKILDACLENKIQRLIFVGSASSFQFGTKKKPGDESGGFPQIYRGMAYMESKHQAMKLVLEYVREKGLDAVVVAPTFMLGDYDYGPSSGELIQQFIKRGLKYVSSGGRNFAYVVDVAQAMISALEKGKTGEVYILGGENLNYLEFFRLVAEVSGITPPRAQLPSPLILAGGAFASIYGKVIQKPVKFNLKMARIACLGTYYSSEKAKKELDMPQTPIKKAIEESIKSLKRYGYIDEQRLF